MLMLREYEQLSYQEIADLRGTPLNTVRSQLFRARMALKSALETRAPQAVRTHHASAEHIHSPTPEEIMEYLDGEGTAASRASIAAHLASCAACQAIAAEQRGISEHAQAWTVAPAPASLQPPARPRARVLLPLIGAWRPSRWAGAGLAAAAARARSSSRSSKWAG